MRLPWLAMLVVGGLLGLGCGKTVYRSHEAQFCSIDEDDDPFYECSPSSDLVCINTYSEAGRAAATAGPQRMPLYLCRLACDPGKDRCPSGEVCCPGKIEGKTYGKTGACVPESRCDNPVDPRTAASTGGPTAPAACRPTPAATGPPDAPARRRPAADGHQRGRRRRRCAGRSGRLGRR